MKVLVTGAGGFIGTHICNYFEKKGYEVLGWDITMISATWKTACINMLDGESIKERLVSDRPDIIIHCAGSADVGKSVLDPYEDYRCNVTITHNLLFAMQKAQLKHTRMVFLSSAAVYGNPKKLPINENDQLDPLSPYALHKEMCENICRYMHMNYGMDIKVLRIFSAYGEGLKKQIFWDMYKKYSNTQMLKMYGTGNESRDYIYSSDLINAIYLVATRASQDDFVFNIANGDEVTIRKATENFAKAIGLKTENISFTGEEIEGNPINWKADITRLKSLGYERSISFEQGVLNYVEWVVNIE